MPEEFDMKGVTMTLQELKAMSHKLGYRFEVSADGNEERMIRPDGSVAIIAKKKVRTEQKLDITKHGSS